MKRLFGSLLAALGINNSAQVPEARPPTVMAELRARALAVKPSDIGLSVQTYSDRPWGVLMEAGLDGDSAYSLVVLADGTTSLYFSTGGGIIGAGQHREVRAVGSSMLQTATRLQSQAQVAAEISLPSAGNVNFIFSPRMGR